MAAGSDPVAIDAVGLASLRLAGANATLSRGSGWALPMMKRAAEVGVGISSAELLALRGLDETSEAKLRAKLA